MLINDDCLQALRLLDDNSVDSCVTDPPYHLTSIVKRFGSPTAAPAKHGTDGVFARASRGFMGKEWDGGDIAFRPETWREVWRVLKPGAHLFAFSGTRTYHRMVCAIEDAGFEIRDQFAWVYGTGFPKSHSVGEGWGTAVKPAWEPIVLARKPLIGTVAETVLAWGTGAINIDASRVNSGPVEKHVRTATITDANSMAGKSTGSTGSGEYVSGRFPANIVHDGSPEVLAGFPDSAGQRGKVGGQDPKTNIYGEYGPRPEATPRNDSGSAARFFYSAKASKADRAGSKHPTVKPLDLMRWLVTMITPPGGTVLDLFAGSGTTPKAAADAGFRYIAIERETEYFNDMVNRMQILDAWHRNPTPVKLIRKTDTGGYICEDERGIRHYSPDDRRIIQDAPAPLNDLFAPL